MTEEELRFYVPDRCFCAGKTVIDEIWEDSREFKEGHVAFQEWLKRREK